MQARASKAMGHAHASDRPLQETETRKQVVIAVEVVASTLQGEIISRMLAEQGIPSELSQEADADTGGPAFGPQGSVQVLVLEEHAADARRLLADYYAGRIAAPPAS